MKLRTCLLLFLFTTSCTSLPDTPGTPVNQLVLTKTISIPPRNAHVTFQEGKPQNGRDLFSWHCDLEISTVNESAQSVLPDSFVIQRSLNRLVSDEQSGMPVMSVGNHFCGERYYETHYWLSSTKQPGVRKMTCRIGYNFCENGDYINREQLHAVLGDWFNMQ
jgi:hypothetical protein